ncbi:MAG: DUF3526 domain-containing protein [Myxococcota bacterium]
MMSLAVRFELRALLRNPAGLVALVGFLAVGALALVVGERHVAQWKDEVAQARLAQAEAVEEARSYLAAGVPGPEDKPRIDIRKPQWQDQLAGSRIVREPTPLAGIAAGAVDPAPAAFLVTRWARPLSATGYRIENPELAAGAVDLVFVLTLLVPLLLGVLGLGIGTRERESGLAPLIVVQAGGLRGWMVARTLTVAGLAGAASTLLCLVAGLVGGAGVAEVGQLVAFALGYTGLWSGLLLAVNARVNTVRAAAFGFGVIWTVLCILVPAVATEVAYGRVEQDFGIEATVDARAQRWGVWEMDVEDVLIELQARYPELDTDVEALSKDNENIARGAIEASQFAARLADELGHEREARHLAERAAWASPAVAVALGIERLAGVGADASSAYRHRLGQAVEARVDWVVHRAWADQPLTGSDFEALVAGTPEAFVARAEGLVLPSSALVLWGTVAWVLALAGLRRDPD